MLTVALEDVRAGDRARVGDEAAGCAALRGLGLDVPRGFVITTDAFHALRPGLRELVDPSLDDAELARRCAARQAQVRATPLPHALAAELDARLRGAMTSLAVRSSATSDDGLRSSFAGVFESVLDVRPEGLADAVRACWASFFSAASITHHLREGLDPRRGAMAVLVQELLAAEWSGELSSREPTGVNPEEAVLSFTRGPGERRTAGGEGGATLRVDRASGRVLDGDAGRLPAGLLPRLLEAAATVERALGHPQELAWALRGDRLVFLRARPITTIEPLREPPIVWTRELAEERFPQPMSPLGWSTLQTVARVNDRTLRRRFGLVAKRPGDLARTCGHYVYSNEGFFSIPGSMSLNPLRQARHFPSWAREGLDVLRTLPAAVGSTTPFGVGWLALSRSFRALVLPHAREVERAWRRDLAPLLARIDAFDDVPVERLTNAALWEHRLALQPVAERYMEPDLAIDVIKRACSAVLERFGETLAGRRDARFVIDLTSGLSIRALDMNAELGALFERLRADREVLEDLEDQRFDALVERLASDASFTAFLARNGHNTSNADLMQPTWGEDPRQVLALLRSYSRSAARHGAAARREEQLARFARAKDRVLAALRRTKWMVPFFEETVATLRAFMAIDEEHHFYRSRLHRPLRRTFQELGVRLVRSRALERPVDIYFLTHDEVARALRERAPFSRRHLVAARRASFARSRARRPPERYRDQTPLRARDAPLVPPLPLPGGLLQGVGASAGVATGTVRIVGNPEDAAAFREGEVLVTASPDPVWTPLYAVASALVTATGSLLSHGLVSAREYHLPAVMRIPDVTHRLSTGQRVRVDGAQGTVTVELP